LNVILEQCPSLVKKMAIFSFYNYVLSWCFEDSEVIPSFFSQKGMMTWSKNSFPLLDLILLIFSSNYFFIIEKNFKRKIWHSKHDFSSNFI
jgi:hypothetical protein